MGCSFAPNHKGMPAPAFPNMPRAILWQARPIVPQFRAHNGIAHSQTSALGSYRQVLRHLHAVGATAPSERTMIIIETTVKNDERTEVSAVRFSHPTLSAPSAPTDARPCAPVLFLAPADPAAGEAERVVQGWTRGVA
jgi:hypothetical protein